MLRVHSVHTGIGGSDALTNPIRGTMFTGVIGIVLIAAGVVAGQLRPLQGVGCSAGHPWSMPLPQSESQRGWCPWPRPSVPSSLATSQTVGAPTCTLPKAARNRVSWEPENGHGVTVHAFLPGQRGQGQRDGGAGVPDGGGSTRFHPWGTPTLVVDPKNGPLSGLAWHQTAQSPAGRHRFPRALLKFSLASVFE